jgi:Flp pilus assembly protein TadD
MELARDAYMSAIDIDPDAWEAMINLGELNQIAEDPREALRWFERAYAAMDRLYPSEPQRIGPWRAPLGVSIAEQHERFGDNAAAEIWYRRVLDQSPFEPEATTRLAKLLRQSGESAEADALCTALNARIGRFENCPIGVIGQQ